MAHLSRYKYKAHRVKRIVERSLERRRAVRYELQVPVAFFWENAEGGKFQAEGVTRDISDVGVYVLSERCPPMKSKVRVEVMLAQQGIAGASLNSPWQNHGKSASSDEVCGTGKMVPSAGESRE